jgi:serine/threonine protein kinase
LADLERTSEWSETSARPKAFVGKLLLVDESRRLTAGEALQDSWFNNDFLKPDFEDLYKRTIRHWQPSLYKKPVIEFMNAYEVKQLQCSQDVLAAERSSRGRRGQSPVEPPVSDPHHFASPLTS